MKGTMLAPFTKEQKVSTNIFVSSMNQCTTFKRNNERYKCRDPYECTSCVRDTKECHMSRLNQCIFLLIYTHVGVNHPSPKDFQFGSGKLLWAMAL